MNIASATNTELQALIQAAQVELQRRREKDDKAFVRIKQECVADAVGAGIQVQWICAPNYKSLPTQWERFDIEVHSIDHAHHYRAEADKVLYAWVWKEPDQLEQAIDRHWKTAKSNSPELLAELRASGNQTMTEEERFQQRVSFVMGTIGDDSTVTREQVEVWIKENGK